MGPLSDLTIPQRIAVAVAYVAACFAIGIGIGALLTRRQR